MKQNRQYGQLKYAFGQLRLCARGLPGPEQPREAERPLECVFEVVGTGIDRLKIAVIAGEALDGPTKHPWHK